MQTLQKALPMPNYSNHYKGVIVKEMNTPRIMNMDWRALGYWPVWKDGKKIWVKDESKD